MSGDQTGRIIELLIGIQTGQSAIMERLDRHEQRLDRLEQRQERLEQRQERLEQRQERLEQRQERLEQRVDQLEKRFDQRLLQLEKRFDERFDRLRADLMARMDRLQDALTLHKEEVVTSMGAGERAEKIANAMQDVVRSLSEQVTVMVRQIHRLQEEMQQLKGASEAGGK